MHCVIKLKKEGDKLVAASQAQRTHYHHFLSKLEEGDLVEVYYEKVNDTGTIPQIRKVHKMFRIISEHSGYSVEEVKVLVKDFCGFACKRTINNEQYIIPIKSIGDMSTVEISELIEGTVHFAEKYYDMQIE